MPDPIPETIRRPAEVFHPSEFIREAINPCGWDGGELACACAATGRMRATMSVARSDARHFGLLAVNRRRAPALSRAPGRSRFR
jgi:hypothetical protein